MGISETYEIHYTARDSAGPVTDGLIRRIQALDAEVDKVKAKLSGFAAGGGRSSAAMARQVERLEARLSSLKGQLAGVNTTLARTDSGAAGAAVSIGKLSAALLAIHEAVAVVSAIGDGLKHAREESERLAEANLKLRDSMRELANLKGHEGPDDAISGEALLLGMASGLKPDEAVKFLEQFEGSIPAGRQKGNIAPGKAAKDREALEREMAQEGAAFGGRTGLAPQTAGDLAGVVSQYTPIRKLDDFAGQLGAISYGLNEGRGKLDPLARSMLGAAGNAVGSGHVKDLAELSSWVGVASTVAKSAGSSGTQYKQVSNLLNTVGGRTGQYLERVGVAGKGTDLEKLRALRADLDRNGGKDWNTYLNEQGFNNRTDRAATVAMAKNLEVLEQRIARARQMTGNGGETIALDKAFLGRTITGAKRQAEAAQAAAEFVRGKPGESVNVARQMAEGRLKARGEIDTRLTNLGDAAWDSTFGGVGQKVGGHVDSRRMRINKEMLAAADREAERVGVKGVDPRVYKRLNRQEDVDAAYRDVSGRITAKGGDPTGGSKEVVAELRKLVQIAEDERRQAQAPVPAAPAPPRGKPAPAPGRP